MPDSAFPGGLGGVVPPGAGRVLIAVAHGSADPRACATVAELAAMARDRSGGLDLRIAFLGHAPPSLPQALGTIEPGREVTVLPLLLTAAYHSKADIPRILARAARPRISYGAPLGPHPLLLAALDRRLAEAGPAAGGDRARTAVVLAAAGSSDPAANAAIARMAARWQASAGWLAVRPAYACAAAPSALCPATAVAGLLRDGAPRVVVASYLLAPGLFADRIRQAATAAGAAAVSPPLGACPEVADVLLARFAQTGSSGRSAA